MNIKIGLAVVSFFVATGFTACQCKDEIVLVPVVEDVKTEKPDKPDLVSNNLTKDSSQDEVIKAVISDFNSLRVYSEKLERLLK